MSSPKIPAAVQAFDQWYRGNGTATSRVQAKIATDLGAIGNSVTRWVSDSKISPATVSTLERKLGDLSAIAKAGYALGRHVITAKSLPTCPDPKYARLFARQLDELQTAAEQLATGSPESITVGMPYASNGQSLLKQAAQRLLQLVAQRRQYVSGSPGSSSLGEAPSPDPTPTETTASSAIIYPGNGVDVWRYAGQLAQLSATSASFRSFVASQLNEMFSGQYPLPTACAHAAVVTVMEYRPSVAFVSIGAEAGGPGNAPSKCGHYGGATAFYVYRGGRWSAPMDLTAQDYLQCSVLRKWDIPRMTGATRCLEGSKELAYRP